VPPIMEITQKNFFLYRLKKDLVAEKANKRTSSSPPGTISKFKKQTVGAKVLSTRLVKG